jgi:hypothetical protein
MDPWQRAQVIRWGEPEREQIWRDFGKQLRDNVSLTIGDVKPVLHNYPLARKWSEVKDKQSNMLKAMRREFNKGTPWPREFISKKT